MSDRIRLTIAAALTSLLLAAVSLAGVALHAGPSAPRAHQPVTVATPAAQTAPTPSWYEEHD